MAAENTNASGISPEDERLLKQYLAAFCNLYAITPVYRAWRIIQKQNPGLGVSKEQFLDFLDGLDEQEMFCIVVGREEIYDDIDEVTPPIKREIIAQYLYAADDFESYEELKEQQEDKPFYVSDKGELLKYVREGYDLEYIRTTREYQVLHTFVEQTLKAKNADDVLDEIQAIACLDGGPYYADQALYRIGKVRRFPSEEAETEFYRLCEAMCGSVRMHAHRGHTPREIGFVQVIPECIELVLFRTFH